MAEPATCAADGPFGLEAVSAALLRATAKIRIGSSRGHGAGSGVVWGPNLIVTNAHVAFRPEVHVELADGWAGEGQVVRRDPRQDLAVVRIEAGNQAQAPTRDPQSLRPGEVILAAGNPMGHSNAVAMGVVHSSGSSGTSPELVRADIRLWPGFSGGPMADTAGNVVGINTMVAGGLGLAVSSTTARAFVAAASRPRLGVSAQPVLLSIDGDGRQALMVMEVEATGAAHVAGLMLGDVILGAGSTTITGQQELVAALDQAGERLVLDVVRAGRRITTEVGLSVPPSHEGLSVPVTEDLAA